MKNLMLTIHRADQVLGLVNVLDALGIEAHDVDVVGDIAPDGSFTCRPAGPPKARIEPDPVATELTAERLAELYRALDDAERIACAFYAAATSGPGAQFHAFIEFCGLMREWVLIARDTLAAGVPAHVANTHTGTPLVMAPHRAAYLIEKLDCIFGPAFRHDREARAALIATLERAA